ncbi:MAG: DUF166 family protein [Methanosarcina sp.]
MRPSLILRHALKAKAVIAPAEDSKKTPAGVLEQLRKELDTIGVEFESPKPFCDLEKTGKPIIDSFLLILASESLYSGSKRVLMGRCS